MTERRGPPRQRWLLPAAAGVASVAFGTGVGELAAAVLAPASSPFVVVGSLLIDLAPPWAKDAAIALFGTGDKAALLVGIGIVLVAVAAGAGVLESRRPPWGQVVLWMLGLVGAVAASTRAGASLLAIAPSAVAAIGAVIALRVLIGRLPGVDVAEGVDGANAAAPVDRRRFLGWAGGAVAVGALAALGGYALQAGS
ncbi:MAG TPA: oxidoreductase, partial [Agromyces sp.]